MPQKRRSYPTTLWGAWDRGKLAALAASNERHDAEALVRMQKRAAGEEGRERNKLLAAEWNEEFPNPVAVVFKQVLRSPRGGALVYPVIDEEEYRAMRNYRGWNMPAGDVVVNIGHPYEPTYAPVSSLGAVLTRGGDWVIRERCTWRPPPPSRMQHGAPMVQIKYPSGKFWVCTCVACGLPRVQP